MITTTDFQEVYERDDLLSVHVKEEHVEEAVKALLEIATHKGVLVDEVKPTTTVKRFIRAFTYTEVAKGKAYLTGPVFGADTRSSEDAYTSKYKLYLEELMQVQNALEPSTMTDGMVRRYGRTIKAVRA